MGPEGQAEKDNGNWKDASFEGRLQEVQEWVQVCVGRVQKAYLFNGRYPGRTPLLRRGPRRRRLEAPSQKSVVLR